MKFRSFTLNCLTPAPVFSLLHSTLSERNLDTRNRDKALPTCSFLGKTGKKWGCGDQTGLNVKNKGSKARKELKWPWEYFRKLSLITQQEVSLAGQTPLKTEISISEPNPSWSPPLGKIKPYQATDSGWEFIPHPKVRKGGLCGIEEAKMMMLDSLRCSLKETGFVRFTLTHVQTALWRKPWYIYQRVSHIPLQCGASRNLPGN